MESAATITALLVVSFATLIWVLRRMNEWLYFPRSIPAGLKLPPGSMGWPLVGDMLNFVRLFRRAPDAYLEQQFLAKYKGSDGIYKAHLFGSPCIITCSPEMNKFVLGPEGTGSAFLTGWPSPELLGPASMVVVEGVQHKRMRKLLLEAVNHPVALKKALARLEKRFTSSLAQWVEEGTITLREKLRQTTFEDICDSFLSMKPGPLVNTMQGSMEGFVAGMRAFPINIPGFSYHTSLQCRKKIVKIISPIIENRQNVGSRSQIEDFLDVLLEARDEHGDNLTNEEICDNIVAFLLAGHESTSYTIMWTMIFLAKNPEVLSKLRNEHMSLHKKNVGIWLNDFKEMPYTNLVLNEVLRLVNISPFLFRKIGREDVHYQGYLFPKGWKVLIWLRDPHMNPNNFENPSKFYPERFEGYTPRIGQYQPFGYGPRQCPGNMLALLSSRLFIHILITNYKWELLNPDAEITYLPHPKPLDGGKIIFHHL